MSKSITANFEFERSTPGTFRFKEINPETQQPYVRQSDAFIGTIYLRKSFIGSPSTPPQHVKITVDIE